MSNTIRRKIVSSALLLSVSWMAAFLASASGGKPSWPPHNGSGFGSAGRVSLLPEFRPIGGGGNNLQNPALDPIPGSPEIALAPLNFVAGTTNTPLTGPNARVISNVIAGGTGANGQDGQSTDPVASAWIYVFGQFLDHDISLESTPATADSINITVPVGDPVFTAGTTIAMTRAARDPSTNTIVNTVAGYLDLSQLYGSTDTVAASLRNTDGTLQASDNGLALPEVDGFFVTGDPRVMENPELTAVTTLFMREHNFWVAKLKTQHADWTGDQLYNMAKAITTAEYQNIVYKEYLPVMLGPVLGGYKGYDPTVDPQVTQEFSTAAFRVGHSQISETQEGIDNSGSVVFTQSLADAFFNTPEMDETNGIDAQLRAIGVDQSQATDVYTVPTLRNLLFAGLVGGGVDEIDLIAIDIQRQYDVGLGSLNQTRKAIGLKPYKSFAEFTSDPILQASFQNLYGSIDNVDLFMGGLAEKHVCGGLVGSTFQAIIEDQFQALRSGDRFFWQNQKFDFNTAAMIGNTSLADLIKRDTDTTMTLQPNLFLIPGVSKHPHPHFPARRVVYTYGKKISALLQGLN